MPSCGSSKDSSKNWFTGDVKELSYVSVDGTSGTASDLNPDDQELASHQETFFVVLHFSEEWRLATFKP